MTKTQCKLIHMLLRTTVSPQEAEQIAETLTLLWGASWLPFLKRCIAKAELFLNNAKNLVDAATTKKAGTPDEEG